MEIKLGDIVNIDVQITKITDANFPIWVEFELTDVHGNSHVFEEKSPILLSANDTIPNTFPQTAKLTCTVTKIAPHHITVNTAKPHGLHSSKGQFCFDMPLCALHATKPR